jgi:hypothetical protein
LTSSLYELYQKSEELMIQIFSKNQLTDDIKELVPRTSSELNLETIVVCTELDDLQTYNRIVDCLEVDLVKGFTKDDIYYSFIFSCQE